MDAEKLRGIWIGQGNFFGSACTVLLTKSCPTEPAGPAGDGRGLRPWHFKQGTVAVRGFPTGQLLRF